MVSRGSSMAHHFTKAAEGKIGSAPGKTAQEYLLRSVASSCVEPRCVEHPEYALSSVCSRASWFEGSTPSSPRLELAPVFACLRAAAAKAKVERLASRKSVLRTVASSECRVGSQPVCSALRVVH